MRKIHESITLPPIEQMEGARDSNFSGTDSSFFKLQHKEGQQRKRQSTR